MLTGWRNRRKTRGALRTFTALCCSVGLLSTTFTPMATAANNLTVSISRDVGAYNFASQTFRVGSKPSSSMQKKAITQFCSEYNYVGVIGASGRYFSVNQVRYSGKITKSGWAKNSDGEDLHQVVINCRYSLVFKNLPNSNWYVIDFLRDRFGAGSVMSHRMTPNTLQKAGWKVSLNLDDEYAGWSPAFTFTTPKFTSKGCVELAGGPTSLIVLSDPLYSRSNKAIGLIGSFEYFRKIAPNRDDIPDYPTDNDNFGYGAGWESTNPDNYMYFWNIPYSGGYSKIAFLFDTPSGSTQAYTILLSFTPDCQIDEVVNLGRTYP
jgi:hypothetical protein